MDGNSYIRDRGRKIADIIRKYSKEELVDRAWLINCSAEDDIFRNSFCAIWNFTADFDLALWYLAYGQTFGRNTDFMHNKMAELCTNSDKEIITLKKDVPKECPYYKSKNETMEGIFKVDFNKSNKEIINAIYNVYRSEKFSHANKWCNLKAFNKCEYKEKCPINEWINITNRFKLPYRPKDPNKFFYYEPRIFFYYDTLSLLNNNKISNFNELVLAVDTFTNDKTKKTIIIRSILEQTRGISSKVLLFLQLENQFNARGLDDFELIFVDRRAIRVAKRMSFPFYENGLVEAIRKFGEKYKLTAKQIDVALYQMGDVCSAQGCLNYGEGKKCIFYDVCSWDGKR